jgi:hypothetical protein
MSIFFETLDAELKKANVSHSQCQQLIQRLMDYGVICRDESQIEADFYDSFLRLAPLLNDYFAVAGIRFYHDDQFEYVRLVPPGSVLPGVDNECEDLPFGGGLRAPLPPSVVAVTLVLAVEYEKSLREARIDEKGCASLALEALNLSLKNLLGRSLPDNVQERRSLFRQLRQLRIIRMSADADLLHGDSWLLIRPMILTLVNQEVLTQVLTADNAVDDQLLVEAD